MPKADAKLPIANQLKISLARPQKSSPLPPNIAHSHGCYKQHARKGQQFCLHFFTRGEFPRCLYNQILWIYSFTLFSAGYEFIAKSEKTFFDELLLFPCVDLEASSLVCHASLCQSREEPSQGDGDQSKLQRVGHGHPWTDQRKYSALKSKKPRKGVCFSKYFRKSYPK